jgi:hypothetical protein
MSLSPRALRALDILQNNGKFVYVLELNPFTNRRQFVARLYDCYGNVCKGYSYNVLEELKQSGTIVSTMNTSTRTEYKSVV